MEQSTGRASGFTAACPECGTSGSPVHTMQKANGQVVVLATRALVGIQPFYDEHGKRHRHDAVNCHTVLLACVQGHHWSHRFVPRCWCGWPETDTPSTCPTCGQAGDKSDEIEDAHGRRVIEDDEAEWERGEFDATRGQRHRSHRQRVEKRSCAAGHTWGERHWYWPCWCGWPEWVRSAASTDDPSEES
jgi:hypothetical protein